MSLVQERRLFIDGTWVDGHAATLRVRSPATEDVVCEIKSASIPQAEAAIDAARRAFDEGPWPRMGAKERIDAVRRLGCALESRQEQLVDTVIAETGCPLQMTRPVQVGMALKSVRELCDLYERVPGWEHNEAPLNDHLVGSRLRLSIRRYEPVGVVAAISPYNFPFITNVWKLIPALLAGCTTILRPSPQTPLQAIIFGEAAAEAGIPPGVINVVVEGGSACGELLTQHPKVDLVSFTGSTRVGRAVAAQAAQSVKRVILELGGKSVQLHLPDTFTDGSTGQTVPAALNVYMGHAGQGCALQTRLLIPESKRGQVLEAVSEAAKSLRIGDPTSAQTQVGPLVSSAHRDYVAGIVRDAMAARGRLVCGGRIPTGCERGWFYEPTLLEVDSADNPAAVHEIFGPVVTVLCYRDVDEAIALANQSEFGLSSGVYTNDLAAGVAVAERIRAGTVQINTPWATGYTPMGGIKQSGYGSERGALGIRAFQFPKHVVVGSR